MVPSVMAAIAAAKLVQAITISQKAASRALRRDGPTAGLAAAGGFAVMGAGGAGAGGVAVTPSAGGGDESGGPGDSGLFWIESDMISDWLPVCKGKAGTSTSPRNLL